MKKVGAVLSVILLLTLTGCTSVDGYLNDKMKQQSGVLENKNYIQYQNYVTEGKLDQEGYYKADENETDFISGSIHVTFPSNNNLDIKYYRDANRTNMLDTTNCYLNPGDVVYAAVVISEDISSSLYEFSNFNIYDYGADGSRKLLTDWNSDYTYTGVALNIPYDYSGTELSVEPVGKYQERAISLKDYYLDENEKAYDLTGTWLIDDKEYTGDAVSISPVSSYIISYEYDSDEYFYISSTPECYYYNNEDGIVIFKQREATDETADYSVELHKYVSISVVSDKDREISVNGGEKQKVKTNTELSIPHLKYGEYITLETNREWSDLENCRELILLTTEKIDSTYKYTLVVPQKGGEFLFNPADYSYEHGTIEFKCFGSIVTDTQYLAKGSKIYYEQKTADSGYWLATDEHCITVGDEEDTKKLLNEIHFTPKVKVTVKLKQPEYGGRINYFVEGTQINTEEYASYSGTIISMDFVTWEGWKCITGVTDGIEFVVGEDRNQTINVNGNDINNIFKEDEEHKPVLNVVLEKSVGSKMSFELNASGLDQNESKKYIQKLLSNEYSIINAVKIGTESNIVVTMNDRAIQTGKAVRLVIEKKIKDSKDSEKETRYIEDLTELLDPIEIYENGSNSSSTKWYQSIAIKIGVVDIKTFASPVASLNTLIVVKNADTNEILMNGDLIEPDQRVKVTIGPSYGYYVTGKNVSDDKYQETMKYSKYLTDIKDIVEKHPAQKIYSVTLDASDSYAKYTYKLDGYVVSGTIKVRDGQKLSLEYEITDGNYKLSDVSGYLFWKTEKKVTKELAITSDYDGKTISKSDFEISVVKGE